ncbi:MAG TPA: PIG-L deacetylase family protein [Mycobacteriales bacterium]|nr:PIG-L deacetylase family protein [Mycobacteriales bacterium]
MLADQEVARTLVVTAHPDDVDFGAAATVAGWADAGIEVSYCIVTNGDAGGFDPLVPRAEIAGIRQAEQRAAAKELGVDTVVFLGYPDGRVSVSQELRRDITRVIREVRPQRVLTQSPNRNLDRIQASHPDHLAVGEAALCAVYPDARNPFAHPELLTDGLEAWSVAEVWLMGSDQANHHIDVTDAFPRKLAALHRHASQLPEPDGLEPRLRAWLAANAEAAGLPTGRLAEAFYVSTIG